MGSSKFPDYISRLKEVRDYLASNSHQGIEGVIVRDSGISGPKVAILSCTHGNEPVGLAALDYLLSDFTPLKGTLLCILANPKASQRYFEAGCDVECEKARYVDKNLNRLPNNLAQEFDDYEFQRAKELEPLLNSCDAVLDLHSTSADAPAMLITVNKEGLQLVENDYFPFQHVVTHINHFLSGKFLIEHDKTSRLRILAECGQHQCLDASQRGIDISLCFLNELEMICLKSLKEPRVEKLTIYRTKRAVFLPEGEDRFRLKNAVQPFEKLEENQVIAVDEMTGKQAKCPEEGYAIMCPETRNVLDKGEALLFLCDKVEQVIN